MNRKAEKNSSQNGRTGGRNEKRDTWKYARFPKRNMDGVRGGTGRKNGLRKKSEGRLRELRRRSRSDRLRERGRGRGGGRKRDAMREGGEGGRGKEKMNDVR